MIERNFYLQQIISKMWDGNIKIITGIKRCPFNIYYLMFNFS